MVWTEIWLDLLKKRVQMVWMSHIAWLNMSISFIMEVSSIRSLLKSSVDILLSVQSS